MTKKVIMERQKSNQEGSTFIQIDIDKLIDKDMLSEVIHRILEGKVQDILSFSAPKNPVPLDEYIPKAAVRGKLLAPSTLWKHEQKGSLKTYAIGGKKFYRRSEIENLIQEVKR